MKRSKATRKTKTFLGIIATILIISMIFISLVRAVAGVTPATGGEAISADDFATGAWTTLIGPTIAETVFAEIGTGTIIFTIPTGFEFNPAQDVTATVTAGDITLASTTVTPTADTITFEVTFVSTVVSTIEFSDIQVRPTQGTLPNTGDITHTGTATGLPKPGNYGTLTMVAGAHDHFLVVTSGGGTEVAGTAFSVTITAQDQFDNTVTGYTGDHTIDFTSNATAAPDGTAPTIPESETITFATGVGSSTVGFILTNAGETPTITATDEGMISGTSDLITVNPAATDYFTLSAPADITAGSEATYEVTRYDEFGNLVTIGSQLVYLFSDSTGPCEFRETSGEASVISVTIADGASAKTFYYYDEKAGTWTITASDASPADGETGIDDATDSITVLAWAEIAPSLVPEDETLSFEITVTNIISEASIYKTEITYPTNWFVDVTAPTGWVIDDHIPPTVTFRATGGYEIPPDGSAIFRLKMTTPAPVITTDYPWTIQCTDTAEAVDVETVDVTVDVEAPSVIVAAPAVDYYSVGAGNYIWLNLTVTDDVEALPNVIMSDIARFDLLKVEHTTGTTAYTFCYVNTVAIEDGPLAVWFNVTDYVGNWYDGPAIIDVGEVSALAETTVDNTPPFIWITVYDGTTGEELPQPTKPGPYYAGKNLALVDINVTTADYGLESIGPLTGIYINDTLQSGWIFTSTVKTYNGYSVWEHIELGYSISVDDVSWAIYVNATDTSLPSNHTSELTQTILRDLVGPYVVGFTEVEPICGGLIVRGLYAEDLVGLLDYVFSVNGTGVATITEADLTSTTWTANSFNRIAVLDLSAYAGEPVNITVVARDYGENPSDEIVLYEGLIPEGEWYPIELYKGWNLISLPLIPDSAAREDILSLILEQGAGGVIVTYGYNQTIDDWITNPAEVTDGWGYWLYVMEYDVLIVEGRETPEPPATPTTYLFTEGWLLAGFKSTSTMPIADYLASLESETYFEYVYVWNAADQIWDMRPVTNGDFLNPGEGFWIWMYEDQYLIPPI